MRALLRRIWNALARLPALADRPGLRWMISGRLVGSPIVVLVHRGRRSGRIYRTPVEALEERDGEVLISPMRGRRGDWYRNIVAGGLVDARLRGESLRTDWREVTLEENERALRRYVAEHGRYGRFVLRGLMRVNHLEGDPIESVVAALPMLALRTREP